MIRKLIYLFVSFLLLVSCSRETEQLEEKPVPVKVYEVQPGNISDYVRLIGSVSAEDDAVVYAKMSEKIDEINVKVGEKVQKNQVIASLYNESLKQGVSAAEAGLKTAQAQSKLAEQDYERIKKLYDQKAVSQQQFDQAQTQYETASSTLEQVQSQFKQAKEAYENSLIKAPFAGTVAAINFEENQMVTAGQPVAHVISSGFMKAKLQVSGIDANKVSAGQQVEITFPSIPGKEYSGEVSRVNKSLDPLTNTLEIEVRLTDAGKNIKPGLFGEFDVNLKTGSDVLVVPEAAVQQQTEVVINRKTGVQQPVMKYFIFLVRDKKASLKEVKTGIRNEGRVEITEGLQPGDRIIVVGQNIVKAGDIVQIIE